MDYQFLHLLFLVNYAYLVTMLFWQKFKLRRYWQYLAQIVLVAGFSVGALIGEIRDWQVTWLCGGLFIWLGVIPLLLAGRIWDALSNRLLRRALFLAHWRFLITLATGDRQEYQLIRATYLLTEQKYQQAIHAAEALDLNDTHYAEWRDQLLVVGYAAVYDWPRAARLFESRGWYRTFPLGFEVRCRATEALCHMHDLAQAITLLADLESMPDKHDDVETLEGVRLCVHAHAGNMAQVTRRTTALSSDEQAYWRALADMYHGDAPSALTSLTMLTSGTASESLKILALQKLSLLAVPAERLVLFNSLSPVATQLYDSLEQLEHEVAVAQPATTSQAMELLHTPCPSTWSIIATCVLMFGLTEFFGGSTDLLVLLNYGASNWIYVIAERQYWRLLSCLFLHYGYVHLLVNLLGLHFFGRFIESYWGWRRFLIIYFAAGICSAGFSLWWQQAEFLISLGASGAICGLLGAGCYLILFDHAKLDPQIRRHYRFSFLFVIASMVLVGAIVPGLDNTAHLSGFVAGGLLAWLTGKPRH